MMQAAAQVEREEAFPFRPVPRAFPDSSIRRDVVLRKTLALALVPLALITGASLAAARDHRESDYLAEHPKVDGTDFYMFRSYETGREDFVLLIGCYQPYQVPFAGPHCYSMDPDAVYDFNIDQDGDGLEDLIFRFKFTPVLRDTTEWIGIARSQRLLPRPVMNVDPVVGLRAEQIAMYEEYTVDMIVRTPTGDTVYPLNICGTQCTDFLKASDNFGPRSIPDYDAHVQARTYPINIPTTGHDGRVFVGPRRDPMAFDMGSFFDILGHPLEGRNTYPNPLDDFNVTAIVLELPVSALDAVDKTIGAWATASLPRGRNMRSAPEFEGVDDEYGDLMQVSRMGMPLVSSLVIGLDDKDAYNCSSPHNDPRTFQDYFSHPFLPEIIEDVQAYTAPNQFPRYDMERFFLEGIPGFTEFGIPAEMLRFSYDVRPRRSIGQHPLGILGGDPAGYPNGRRPGDDVVDITLSVMMGVYLPPADAPDGSLPWRDGVDVDSSMFLMEFPFLNAPIPGA
jgi:hypothetical protein